MPANIIPDQSANTNLMLDGQVLHGEASKGTPYIKDIFEAVIADVNTLASESNVTPGASKIGVKTTAFTNFAKATNDVEAALEGIDAALATAGGGIKAYQFYDKYLYNAKRNAVHQGVVSSTTVTVAEIRAYLGVDAGVQMDSMSSTSNWAGSNADASVSLYTDDYFEGGSCLAVTKSGTTTNSGGLQRVNFTTTDLTNKKVRVSIKIPAISSGTLTAARVWLGSGGGFTNFKYWDFTTDVGGKTLTAGGNKYIIEVDTSVAATSSGGSYVNTTANSLRVELVLSGNSATFTNFLVDHPIITPDATVLNVDILKRDATTGVWTKIKQNADSYSFPGLTAGQTIVHSTALDNATLTDKDVLFIDIPTSSSYGGQDLFVMVKLQ